MNKFVLSLVALGSLSRFGNAGENLVQSAAVPESAPAPLTLRVHLKTGARYRTHIAVRTDDSSIAGPNTERYVQNAWLQYDSQVVRVEQGSAILRASFKAIGIEVGDGRSTTIFDSRRPRRSAGKTGSAQRQAQDDLSNIVKAVAGENCSYSVSTDGQRIVIRDLEASLQRIVTRMKLPNRNRDAHLKGIMRDMLKGFIGNTDNPSQLTGLYPSRSVSVGDSWHESYLLPRGPVPMKSNTKFTLQARANGVALIGLGGPLTPQIARVADKRISNVTANGSSRGLVRIDELSGWILRSNTSVQSKVSLDVNVGRKIRVTKTSSGSVVLTSMVLK